MGLLVGFTGLLPGFYWVSVTSGRPEGFFFGGRGEGAPCGAPLRRDNGVATPPAWCGVK